MRSNKKLKIFVDGEVLVLKHFSGIGHYTAALLKEIDKLLDEEQYSHINLEIGVPWRMKHEIGRFEFQNFSIRRMLTTPRISNGLKQKRWQIPLDIFFGKKMYVFPNYSGWPLLFSKSVPIIYDCSFILFPEHSDDNNRIFLTDQTSLSVKRASRILTISENSRQEIAEYFGANKANIDISYPVLDTDKFYRRSLEEVEIVKAKYGIFDEYLLFVGNLEPRKNLVGLLKAYRALDEKLQKKYSLLLIGAKGWKDKEITSLIIEMRRAGIRVIQPTDYVSDEDLPALYTGAKVFAYVSIYEGFGIPPTEAMACGTPAISSNNSSLPEAVGNAACLVEATDTKQITAAIEKTLTDDKYTSLLVEKGYEHIKKFNPRQTAIDFIGTLEKASK